MNLLDIASKNGITFKRVGNLNGGEYHGPCPKCGGNDRFHVWPEQGEHGTFWCRGCQLAGDAIEYLIKIEGMTFPGACKEIGKELPEQEEFQKPQFKRPASETFQPRTISAPVDAWVEHAGKFVSWAHDQLLENQEQLDYLAARGITREGVIKFRLGYNSGENGKDLYKAREAWGLETVMTGDKKKKLWLPIGIVIPRFAGETLRRVRIRIPADRRTEQFNVPYYLVPGSAMDTFITREDAKAFTITEAELDAIAIDCQAGDITGAMAMGNSTAKPTDHAFKLLQDCLHISNALDYDATDEPGKKNAGGIGAMWWPKHFAQVERWPVPVGKDPGDAFKAGINLREWIAAGLPPVLTLPPAPKHTAKPASEPISQDNISGAVSSAPPTEHETAPIVITRTAKDGRIFHITEDKAEYARLVAAGEIVFDFAEIELAIKSKATPEEAANFLTVKQTFPGTRITKVIQASSDEQPDRPTYHEKYNQSQETP
jgi:hypothetical protein